MSNLTFNQETKTKWINIMQPHQDADRIIQGKWLDENDGSEIHSGCFFGCAMQTSNNPLSKAIDEMHLPEWLVYLAEKIFEGLPEELAVTFPVDLLSVIPVDADIESVRHQLAIKRLESLIKKSHGDQVNSAIKLVIEYHKNPTESAARSAVWSAARSAESAARAKMTLAIDSVMSDLIK